MKVLISLPRCPISRRVQRLLKASLAILLFILFMTFLSDHDNLDPDLELSVDQTRRILFSTPRTMSKQKSLKIIQDTAPKSLRQEITRKDDPLFVNVTMPRWTKSVVNLIPEDSHLTHNKSVFKLNMSISNTFDYDILIDSPGLCAKEEKVYLLIIIPSVAGDYERRRAIRRTWLGAGARKQWPLVQLGLPVKHIFLLGLRPRANWKRLQVESRRNNDIVLAAFADTYRNLTTKVLVGFDWVVQHCPQAQMVLKVDQDTLINMPLMLRLLYNIQHKATKLSDDFVLGLNHRNPVVRRIGKWGVSESSYPLPKFPFYLYGHTYAVSSPGATSRLLKAARHYPLLAPEDAFITGVLAKTTGVTRLSSSAFTVCCRRLISRCEVVWNERAAFTGLQSVDLLYSLWDDIMHRRCNPKKHFKEIKPKNSSSLHAIKLNDKEKGISGNKIVKPIV